MKTFSPIVLGLLFAASAVGQTPTITQIFSFPFTITNPDENVGYWPDGYSPQGPLLQASDGNFYGTASLGGYDGQCTGASGTHLCGGTVFKLAPAGQLTVLHTFSWGSITAPYADGNSPNGGLIEGPDGYLYGTAMYGGQGSGQIPGSGGGVVFRISKTGAFQNLHSFCMGSTCTEGRIPSSLVLGRDGKFYGTTLSASPASGATGGTIFRISAGGVFETVYGLKSIPDGGSPMAQLIQGSDCNLYGTAFVAGPDNNSSGTVFRLTPASDYQVLHSYSSTASQVVNGRSPRGALIQASNGKFYGDTASGGVYDMGVIFEISPNGDYRKLFDLNRTGQGQPFNYFLIQASDGNLWGSGTAANSNFIISVFSTDGALVHSIPVTCGQTGTGAPIGPFTQALDGKLYGAGGLGGCSTSAPGGAIFSIDAGLPKLPNPAIAAVTNGASFAAGSLVPGEIATVFGSNLTSSTGINLTSSLPLPTSFLNSTVLVNGCAATPLFAVDNVSGQQQINFQAPWEIAGQQAVAVQIVNNGGISPAIDVPVLAAQPGIINYSSGGNTYGAILHADYSLATTASPATAGETVLIYGTGLGAVSTPQQDGTAAKGESTIALPTVTIGGTAAMVTFSGLAPGFVGLNQVNIMIPLGTPSGNQPVVMTVGGVASNTVLLPIH